MPGPFWAPTLKGNDKTDGLKKPCVVPFCDLMWAMRATKALKNRSFSNHTLSCADDAEERLGRR